MKNKFFKSLKFKLVSLVFIGMIPLLLGIFFYVFPTLESYLIEQRKAEVETSVELLIGILEKMQEEVEFGKIPKNKRDEEVQKLFAKLRYNKTDYFFAYDTRGYTVAHGIKPEMIGTDRFSSKDPDGKMYVREFLTYVDKEDGGFVGYKFEKEKGGEPLDKVSYVKFFAPFRWIVGSGVYLDDIKILVSELRNKVMLAIGLISLLVFAISTKYANQICTKIESIVRELFSESEQVATVALEIGKASQALSASTSQQAAALQETSASIEETSAMISKNAENANASQSLSKNSQQSVETGKTIMDDMIHSIEAIADSNKVMITQIEEGNKEVENIINIINEIGEKTKVINDIVFQTKLLSFNASVEAARAGEQGKGFAVVAEEVGNLAQMSGNSAKEISELLAKNTDIVKSMLEKSRSRVSSMVVQSENKMKGSREIAKKCVHIFDEIVTNAEKVTEMVSEISTASNEQARGIKEINAAIAELDVVGQQNSTMSNTTKEFAEQLKTRVLTLKKNTNDLEDIIKGEAA